MESAILFWTCSTPRSPRINAPSFFTRGTIVLYNLPSSTPSARSMMRHAGHVSCWPGSVMDSSSSSGSGRRRDRASRVRFASGTSSRPRQGQEHEDQRGRAGEERPAPRGFPDQRGGTGHGGGGEDHDGHEGHVTAAGGQRDVPDRAPGGGRPLHPAGPTAPPVGGQEGSDQHRRRRHGDDDGPDDAREGRRRDHPRRKNFHPRTNRWKPTHS